MATNRRLFTLREAAYLRSLPAVKEVNATRIIYSDRFKVECMRRYLKGESASKIFREAGLDPALIGSKRIERCVARWKNTKHIVQESVGMEADGSSDGSSAGVSPGRSIDAESVLESQDIANAAFRALSTSKTARDMFDMRDLIIYQQTRQIASLQEKVDELQRRLDGIGKSSDGSDDDAEASLTDR